MKAKGAGFSLFGVSQSELANFTKNLSVIIKSGATVSDALNAAISQLRNGYFKRVLQIVLSDIKEGSALSTSLAKFPRVFDKFFLSVISVGEESGTLEKNLQYLSVRAAKDLMLRRKVKEALFYPTIVISATLIVGLGISIFILPKMSDLFKSFDVSLPTITLWLLKFSDFMRQYNILVVVGVVLIYFAFKLVTQAKPIKPSWLAFLTNMPAIGNFLVAVETSSFCRNLGIMMESGLPINHALKVMDNTTQNGIFLKYINLLHKGVNNGQSISDQLSSALYPKFPAMAKTIISTGEKSGQLSEMLIYLGDYYESETESQTKNLSTVLEPVLLLFIGLIVAAVALAVILPIYQLTGSIKR